MSELFAQTGDVSPTTLAGLLLACIGVLAGVIATGLKMGMAWAERMNEKNATNIASISERHDKTILDLDTRWREERDRDRSRADTRESQMAEAFQRLTDKLPDLKG